MTKECTGCDACIHQGPKLWHGGRDDEEMRSYCFELRLYEPNKVCDKFEDYRDEQH